MMSQPQSQPYQKAVLPPKAPVANNWGELDVVISLHDEEESLKPASTLSKKKKVKKLKKKKPQNADNDYGIAASEFKQY